MINFDKIDAMLVTSGENIRYITGFSGSAGICVVTPDCKYLLTDFRYKEQSAIEAPECEIIVISDKYSIELKKLFDRIGVETIGFEPDDLSFSQYESFRKICKKFVPYPVFVDGLRVIKTEDEISCISKASDIAQNAFDTLLKVIKPGMTEMEVANELDYLMRKNGANESSFDTIAVAGKNSSLVHGKPSEHRLANGDFLLMDFGCKYNGYCSDMTRTVAIGEVSNKQLEVYNIVLEAQLAALEAVKPGALASDIDKIARDIIEHYGYGENFGHALGHGVGLMVHEEPRLSSKSDTVLEPGMIVTIEPGIYIEGEFGVRIEDLVVVTDKNYQNLCQKTKKEVIYI